MKHSTAEFETKLKQMDVEITSITKAYNHVIKALGYLNGKLYKWDAVGSCYFGHERVPENDIRFIYVSSDKRTVTVADEIHYKVRRRFWHRMFICSKCSLRKDCDTPGNTILWDTCTSGFDGFFKRMHS
jgi:hypothetical protein